MSGVLGLGTNHDGEKIERSAIDELRLLVRNFDSIDESTTDGLTCEQIVALHRAWLASGWDIGPHQWTPRQRREALRGIAPRWESVDTERGCNMRPVYTTRAPKVVTLPGNGPAGEACYVERRRSERDGLSDYRARVTVGGGVVKVSGWCATEAEAWTRGANLLAKLRRGADASSAKGGAK